MSSRDKTLPPLLRILGSSHKLEEKSLGDLGRERDVFENFSHITPCKWPQTSGGKNCPNPKNYFQYWLLLVKQHTHHGAFLNQIIISVNYTVKDSYIWRQLWQVPEKLSICPAGCIFTIMIHIQRDECIYYHTISPSYSERKSVVSHFFCCFTNKSTLILEAWNLITKSILTH